MTVPIYTIEEVIADLIIHHVKTHWPGLEAAWREYTSITSTIVTRQEQRSARFPVRVTNLMLTESVQNPFQIVFGTSVHLLESRSELIPCLFDDL